MGQTYVASSRRNVTDKISMQNGTKTMRLKQSSFTGFSSGGSAGQASSLTTPSSMYTPKFQITNTAKTYMKMGGSSAAGI